MWTQKILNTSKSAHLAILFFAAGLLVALCTSNVTAQTAFPQKNMALDQGTRLLDTDRTELIVKPEDLNLKEPLPNIIQGPDDVKEPSGTSFIIALYFIAILIAFLFVCYVAYTVLYFFYLSRREWTQRVGDSEYDQEFDPMPKVSAGEHGDTSGRPRPLDPYSESGNRTDSRSIE